MPDKIIVVGKSSTRARTFNVSLSNTNTSDVTNRDTDTDQDDRIHKFTDAEYANLTEIYHVYRDEFNDGWQFEQLDKAQRSTCCLWTYVSTQLYDKLKDSRRGIIAKQEDALSDTLYQSRGHVASIAGCTRNSFGVFIEQDTLRRHALDMSELESKMDLEARALEVNSMLEANNQMYHANVDGPHTIFTDYAFMLNQLNGAEEWDEHDVHVDDLIDRSINTTVLATSASWTVGQVSDASTDFSSDWGDITSAAGGI